MQKNAKNATFFYKERKRMQRMPNSFIKNAKECKNVAFFWKEHMPNPDIWVGGFLLWPPHRNAKSGYHVVLYFM